MLGKFGSLLSFRGHSIGREETRNSSVPNPGTPNRSGKRRRTTARTELMAGSSEQLECRALLAMDINISNVNDSQFESDIAINPTNPQNLAVVASGGDGNGDELFVAYSFNGGQNWTKASLDNNTDFVVGTFEARFNGSLEFDALGNLHVVYLTELLVPRTVVYAVSTTGGASFTARQIAGSNTFNDMPRLAVGPAGPNTTNQAVVITYKNNNSDLVATTAVASSLGGVSTFSTPQVFYRRSITAEGDYPSPAVGPNGEIAITWQDTSSSTAAEVWITADVDGTVGGLSFPNARIVLSSNAGDRDSIPATPFVGSYASPRLAYDLSNRATRGRLYLVYEDKASIFSNDDTNVFIISSSNNGSSFGSPVRINDDAGANSQFFADISVDPITSALFVAWYDARNDLGGGIGTDTDFSTNSEVEIYGSYSTDGGQTWAPNVLISDGVSNRRDDPNLGTDFGRYIGVTNYGGVGYVAWADNSSTTGELDILFDSYQYDQSPTINFVPDVTLSPVVINEDSNTGALTFVVGDDITLPDDLTLTGISSNPSIVPNGGIVFGGSDADRTVTVTPLQNRSGELTITIVVTDSAGLTSTKSFDLRILPTPDPLPEPDGTTPVTTVFTDATSTPLADNAVTNSTVISVSGLETFLYDANVSININHPRSNQLQVVLISPQGTRVTLTSANGGVFADVFAGSTFDDQIISAPVTDYDFEDFVTAPYLVPEGALAQLVGENPNGDWTLEITDLTANDTGTLNAWSLELTTLPASPQLQVFGGTSVTATPTAIPDDGTPLLLPLVFNVLDRSRGMLICRSTSAIPITTIWKSI
jgi:subtilisin-like proprotein convertase family protein